MRLLPLLLGLFAFAGCTRLPPLATVPKVDLKRMEGDWHVIANIPYWLEDGKVATFDRYRLRGDGTMDNEYHFRRGSFAAPEEVWRGTAWPVPGTGDAEWRVRFLWPFSVAYLVIELDPDYRWLMVGHPSRDYLWILSRTRQLAPELVAALRLRATAHGYDAGRIALVPQPPEPVAP